VRDENLIVTVIKCLFEDVFICCIERNKALFSQLSNIRW